MYMPNVSTLFQLTQNSLQIFIRLSFRQATANFQFQRKTIHPVKQFGSFFIRPPLVYCLQIVRFLSHPPAKVEGLL